MIVTLCIKCRCTTSLTTEPMVNTKVVTKDVTKFMVVVCAACNDDNAVDSYSGIVTTDQIVSMQEWKYIIDYANNQDRSLTINTVGDHVVVFNHDKAIPYNVKVVKSHPIVTCKEHMFHVHTLPPRVVSRRVAQMDIPNPEYDYPFE